MKDERAFLPYRPLDFAVRGSFCDGDQCRTDPDLGALEFTVEEVYGTSPTVDRGERYVVRGRYDLRGPAPFAISIGGCRVSFGATAYLLPGKGRFEISTEVLELVSDDWPPTAKRPNGLGIVVGNEQNGTFALLRWVMLETVSAKGTTSSST